MAKFTKGQKKLLSAIESGAHEMFHRSVIEPLERAGVIFYTGRFRLVGCNAFPAKDFVILDPAAAASA